jgi:hypothetical protein
LTGLRYVCILQHCAGGAFGFRRLETGDPREQRTDRGGHLAARADSESQSCDGRGWWRRSTAAAMAIVSASLRMRITDGRRDPRLSVAMQRSPRSVSICCNPTDRRCAWAATRPLARASWRQAIAANSPSVVRKEKWQSTPKWQSTRADSPRCKSLSNKGLWHGLAEEEGRKRVQAYYVAVGSLAVWQSTRRGSRLVAAMPTSFFADQDQFQALAGPLHLPARISFAELEVGDDRR